MTIPAGIRHFPQSNLFIVVDLHHAKGYLALRDEVHNVFSFEVPAEKYTQEKPGFSSGDLALEKHVFHDHVVKQAAQEITKHMKEAHEMTLFIHARLKKDFLEGMSEDIKKKITHVIEGDLTKENPVDLAKRMTM